MLLARQVPERSRFAAVEAVAPELPLFAQLVDLAAAHTVAFAQELVEPAAPFAADKLAAGLVVVCTEVERIEAAVASAPVAAFDSPAATGSAAPEPAARAFAAGYTAEALAAACSEWVRLVD